MRSKYSDRLYNLIVNNQKDNEWFVEIDDFKKAIDCGDKYRCVSDLLCRTIDPAIEEVNGNGEIKVEYDIVRYKRSRMIQGIKFKICKSVERAKSEEIKVNSIIEQAICDKLSQINKDIKSYEEPLKRLKEQKAELLKWCKDNGITIIGEQ